MVGQLAPGHKGRGRYMNSPAEASTFCLADILLRVCDYNNLYDQDTIYGPDVVVTLGYEAFRIALMAN